MRGGASALCEASGAEIVKTDSADVRVRMLAHFSGSLPPSLWTRSDGESAASHP
jgi:hypothetical protein